MIHATLNSDAQFSTGAESRFQAAPRTLKERQRPEIDGLRAIAIIGVVLYHARVGCLGGFVGVDIFFVISGFLICGIILRELEAGHFSLGSFWARRVRRLFPALAVCLGVTLIVGSFLLFPTEMESLANQAIACLGFAANFKMRSLLGWYWGPRANTVPLLHFWLLAVEEQFYFCLPFVLLAAHRWVPKRKGLVLLVLFLCSLALCQQVAVLYRAIIPFAPTPGFNFYMLPARAWELLLGCLAAWLLQGGMRISTTIGTLIATFGLVAIVYAMFYPHDGTYWPSLWALLPTGGALCILITPEPAGKEHVIARMLAVPAVRFIGLISYSLYLWHWPLIVFLNQYKGSEHLTALDRWLMVAASIALAAGSWRFIEQPFRQGSNSLCLRARPLLVGAAVVWVLLMTISLWAVESHGFENHFANRLTPRVNHVLFPPRTPEAARDYGATGYLAEGGVQFNTEQHSPRCIILGDSHACSMGSVFEALSRTYKIPTAMLSQNACPGFFAGTNQISIADPTYTISKADRDKYVKDWITRWKPDLVIVAGRWEGQMLSWGATPAASSNALAQACRESTRWLADHAKRVVVLTQVPHLPLADSDAGPEIWKQMHGHADALPILKENEGMTKLRNTATDILRKEADPRVVFLDIEPPFKNEDGSIRYYDEGGRFYRDSNHLNRNGALRLAPLLEPYFRALAF